MAPSGLTQNAADLGAAEDLLQVAHAAGQRLHFAQTFLHNAELFHHGVEGLLELFIQRVLQLFIHGFADLRQLRPVFGAQGLHPVGDAASQLLDLGVVAALQTADHAGHLVQLGVDAPLQLLKAVVGADGLPVQHFFHRVGYITLPLQDPVIFGADHALHIVSQVGQIAAGGLPGHAGFQILRLPQKQAEQQHREGAERKSNQDQNGFNLHKKPPFFYFSFSIDCTANAVQ